MLTMALLTILADNVVDELSCEFWGHESHSGDWNPQHFIEWKVTMGDRKDPKYPDTTKMSTCRRTTDRNPSPIAFLCCGKVEFPEPQDRNVNMLPFILGQVDTLPEDLRPYYSLIARCPIPSTEKAKVCYLTVSESFVLAHHTQRQKGLHIEAPMEVVVRSDSCSSMTDEGIVLHDWGMGHAVTPDQLHGGIYMASTMDDTTGVWNIFLDQSCHVQPLNGGIEYLRPFLGPCHHRLQAGQLCWMTDRTPHEAWPQPKRGYRQFFRLVTSDISVWSATLCTPNPLVTVPNHVQVIHATTNITN